MGILSAERLIVGYDLGDSYCQISFASSEDGEAQTLSQVAGAQVYNIPTALCRHPGMNQWLYGREALRCEDENGILVENLLSLALDGEPILIGGESFEPVALLALFFRRSLGLLPQTGAKLTALMITCASLDRRTMDVVRGMVERAHVKADRIAVQSYEESFYTYMLRQPMDLWNYDAVLFDYRDESVRALRLESNRRTTPIVSYVRESWHDLLEKDRDEAFLQIAREVCGERAVSSIFLIGEGFSEDWMKESLRFLCRGRRVFQGNNLYSKGACCGMQERILPSERGKAHVFLGNDKLKSNIGMGLLRQGEESYYALLDGGTNWYEADQSVELYIQDGNELALTITPLTEDASSGRSRLVRIVLEGLPEGAARLSLRLFLENESRLGVEVHDLGFGELRAASGRAWKEEIEL